MSPLMATNTESPRRPWEQQKPGLFCANQSFFIPSCLWCRPPIPRLSPTLSGKQSCRLTGTTSRPPSHTSRPGSSCAVRHSLCGRAVTETSSSSTENSLSTGSMTKQLCCRRSSEVRGRPRFDLVKLRFQTCCREQKGSRHPFNERTSSASLICAVFFLSSCVRVGSAGLQRRFASAGHSALSRCLKLLVMQHARWLIFTVHVVAPAVLKNAQPCIPAQENTASSLNASCTKNMKILLKKFGIK